MNLFQKIFDRKRQARREELSLLFIILAAFSGGSVSVFGKYALAVFHPFTITFLRFLLATLTLLPIMLRQKNVNWKTFSALWPVAVIGALNPIIFFIGLQFTQASFSPLIYASVPALTALYMALVHKHKIDNKNLIGIALGLVGVSIVVLLPYFETGLLTFSVFGNMLIFIATLAFFTYGLISKQKQTELKVSPLVLTFYFCVITMFMSLPLAIFEIYTYGISAQLSWLHGLSILWIGVVGTTMLYLAYQYALKHGTEMTASLFTYLQPISGILLAVLILNESITLPLVIGGSLAIIGAAVASRK